MSIVPKIQILINEHTIHGEYNDALYIPLTEYAFLTPEQIEAMKQERVQAWVSLITAPQPQLSDEEMCSQLRDQLREIEARRDEILNQLELLDGEQILGWLGIIDQF